MATGVAQIVAQAWMTFSLGSVGEPPHHVEVLVLVFENRNNSDWRFMACSFPQRVFGPHITPMREQRRSDAISQAYFGITSRLSICNNMVLGPDTDLGHISSESDDDPAPAPRPGGSRSQRHGQGGAASFYSDSDDGSGRPGRSAGGSARQRLQRGNAVATSPPVVQHAARRAGGRAPQHDTGNRAGRTW